jgi:glycosyltransferase involved in cell wall biosynthesis
VFGPAASDRVWVRELRDDGLRFRIASSASRAELSQLVRSLLDESDEPTVLHTHFMSFDVTAAARARGRRDTKVFWHVHTPHRATLSMHAKYALAGRRVERLLCAGPELAQLVLDLGAPRRRVELLPTAVDAERFWLLERQEREIARLRLGLPADQPLLVHFGGDWKRKGGDLFMQTLRILRGAGIEAVGLAVGGGRAAHQARDELRLGHAVHVLGPIEDVRLLYAAADVFLAPARAGGTPAAVMEALSSGTAVVASDIPAHQDMGAGIASCVTTPGDPAAIADATRSLLDRDDHEVAADGLSAHLWMRDNLHLPTWADALVDRYEHALEQRGDRFGEPLPATA